MTDKIISVDDLTQILAHARQQGKKVVFTNGCFDLLHVGHIRYLQTAKKLGDLLVVAINSDTSVRALGKGSGRPIVPEGQRSEVVAALGCVDFVVSFTEPTPLHLITVLQPDILVKGGDWSLDNIIGRQEVEARNGKVYAISMTPNMSTTQLIQRIHQEVKPLQDVTFELETPSPAPLTHQEPSSRDASSPKE